MNRVQIRQETRQPSDKFLRRHIAKSIPALNPTKKRIHLGPNILRVAEHRLALRDPHGPILPRPRVNIPEQVPMDRAIVRRIEIPLRQPLPRTQPGNLNLKALKSLRVSNIELVAENSGARIKIRIVEGPVASSHQRPRAALYAAMVTARRFAGLIDRARLSRFSPSGLSESPSTAVMAAKFSSPKT